MWKDFWRATLWPSAKEHIHEANRPHGGAVLTSVLSLDISTHVNPLEGLNNSPVRELSGFFLHMVNQSTSTSLDKSCLLLLSIFLIWTRCLGLATYCDPASKGPQHKKINAFRAVWLFRILKCVAKLNCAIECVYTHTVTCFLQCHVYWNLIL